MLLFLFFIVGKKNLTKLRKTDQGHLTCQGWDSIKPTDVYLQVLFLHHIPQHSSHTQHGLLDIPGTWQALAFEITGW